MTTHSSEQPIVDRDQLIGRMMGSSEMAKRMLSRFIEIAPAECDLMESTVRMGDKASTASMAHRYKGTAQTLGSSRVAEVAARLESKAHEDDVSELLEIVDELRSLHREVESFLQTGFSVNSNETRGE